MVGEVPAHFDAKCCNLANALPRGQLGLLHPAMTLSSKIIAPQDLVAVNSVGYGSSFVADKPMRIGIVACGYADAYPRIAGTGTPVLVNGVRTRTVGRVSMDMITVDLAQLPAARIGNDVTLWGRASTGAVLSIDEVAVCARTVGYELLCALAQRVQVQVEATEPASATKLP